MLLLGRQWMDDALSHLPVELIRVPSLSPFRSLAYIHTQSQHQFEIQLLQSPSIPPNHNAKL